MDPRLSSALQELMREATSEKVVQGESNHHKYCSSSISRVVKARNQANHPFKIAQEHSDNREQLPLVAVANLREAVERASSSMHKPSSPGSEMLTNHFVVSPAVPPENPVQSASGVKGDPMPQASPPTCNTRSEDGSAVLYWSVRSSNDHASFYGRWAPGAFRPLQDRLGLSRSHIRWIQEALVDAGVPLHRPLTDADLTKKLREKLRMPLLFQNLLGRVLMVPAGDYRPDFIQVCYPQPQHEVGVASKLSMNFEVVSHLPDVKVELQTVDSPQVTSAPVINQEECLPVLGSSTLETVSPATTTTKSPSPEPTVAPVSKGSKRHVACSSTNSGNRSSDKVLSSLLGELEGLAGKNASDWETESKKTPKCSDSERDNSTEPHSPAEAASSVGIKSKHYVKLPLSYVHDDILSPDTMSPMCKKKEAPKSQESAEVQIIDLTSALPKAYARSNRASSQTSLGSPYDSPIFSQKSTCNDICDLQDNSAHDLIMTVLPTLKLDSYHLKFKPYHMKMPSGTANIVRLWVSNTLTGRSHDAQGSHESFAVAAVLALKELCETLEIPTTDMITVISKLTAAFLGCRRKELKKRLRESSGTVSPRWMRDRWYGWEQFFDAAFSRVPYMLLYLALRPYDEDLVTDELLFNSTYADCAAPSCRARLHAPFVREDDSGQIGGLPQPGNKATVVDKSRSKLFSRLGFLGDNNVTERSSTDLGSSKHYVKEQQSGKRYPGMQYSRELLRYDVHSETKAPSEADLRKLRRTILQKVDKKSKVKKESKRESRSKRKRSTPNSSESKSDDDHSSDLSERGHSQKRKRAKRRRRSKSDQSKSASRSPDLAINPENWQPPPKFCRIEQLEMFLINELSCLTTRGSGSKIMWRIFFPCGMHSNEHTASVAFRFNDGHAEHVVSRSGDDTLDAFLHCLRDIVKQSSRLREAVKQLGLQLGSRIFLCKRDETEIRDRLLSYSDAPPAIAHFLNKIKRDRLVKRLSSNPVRWFYLLTRVICNIPSLPYRITEGFCRSLDLAAEDDHPTPSADNLGGIKKSSVAGSSIAAHANKPGTSRGSSSPCRKSRTIPTTSPTVELKYDEVSSCDGSEAQGRESPAMEDGEICG